MINSNGDTVLTYISRILGDTIIGIKRSSCQFTQRLWPNASPCCSIIYDNIETSKELIVLGADVNRRNSLGETPLMTTSHKGRLACTELLLLSGANPNIQCKTGETALMSL